MNFDELLMDGAYLGDLQQVEEALAGGADIRTRSDYSICWASRRGHTEVVELLLKVGADACACGNCPLKWAREQGYPEIVKLLEEHIEYLKTASRKPMHPVLYKHSRKDSGVLEVLNRQRN